MLASNINHLKSLKTLNNISGKYKGPLIVRMFGTLNKLDLSTENRYILCNFLDQYSDLVGLKKNIYIENNNKSITQLFLMTYRKAKEFKLLNELYNGYLESIDAICKKKDTMNVNEF